MLSQLCTNQAAATAAALSVTTGCCLKGAGSCHCHDASLWGPEAQPLSGTTPWQECRAALQETLHLLYLTTAHRAGAIPKNPLLCRIWRHTPFGVPMNPAEHVPAHQQPATVLLQDAAHWPFSRVKDGSPWHTACNSNRQAGCLM